MVMTSIMTTDAEVMQKMGENVSANFTDAMKTAAGLQGESMVNTVCTFNYSDAITTGINADVKGLFSDIVSSFIAIQGISYDMSGYTSRVEAEDMINILRDSMLRGLGIIRVKNTQDFVNAA